MDKIKRTVFYTKTVSYKFYVECDTDNDGDAEEVAASRWLKDDYDDVEDEDSWYVDPLDEDT